MKVVFAGTPVFAAQALEAILAAGFDVPLVLTQPDRPSGRGMKSTASAVKQVALIHGVDVAQPASLKLEGAHVEDARAVRALLHTVCVDVMVVAAYGLILPADVLEMPKYGCVNIHASLLPRWRGAAPIHRAVEAGDAQTGVTLMQMDVGLDTGAMLQRSSVAITEQHTTGLLHDELAHMGAAMVVEYLHALAQGNAPEPQVQPLEGVTYAEKIKKTEAALDWTHSAEQLARKVRALDPAPGCTTVWQGQTLKIWAADACAESKAMGTTAGLPGEILSVDASGVRVACGLGVLRVMQMQVPGGKRISAQQVAQNLKWTAGVVLA